MNISNIHILNAQWLFLLPCLWVYLIWWHQKRQKGHQQASIVDVDLAEYNHFYHPLTSQLLISQQKENAKQSATNAFWKNSRFWINSLVLSLLIVTLSQPVLIGERLPDPPPERDIIFLVDTSVSMQLRDYEQEGVALKRIDVLRNLLDEFTVKMKGEKISIILFAEKGYVLVPLTSDQSLIRHMLKRITSTLAGRYTAVGDALLMALNETKKQEALVYLTSKNAKKRHQTFILFTDADTSRGKVTTTAAAQIIAEHGIPVFTIAIGSTQKEEDKIIQGGLYQPVDLALLKDVSKQTGGKSYQVNDADAMQNALSSILKQRQNTAKVEPIYRQEIIYHYFLFMALGLLVLSHLLTLFQRFKDVRRPQA